MMRKQLLTLKQLAESQTVLEKTNQHTFSTERADNGNSERMTRCDKTRKGKQIWQPR